MSESLPLTEQAHPDSQRLEQQSIQHLVALMRNDQQNVLSALSAAEPAIIATIESTVRALRAGGRLFYIGAGTSGRLGVLDAAECPPTFRTDPQQVQGLIAGGEVALSRAVEGAEDNESLAIADLEKQQLGPQDMVIGIAASGKTPYVRAGLRFAHAQDACTALIACTPLPQDDPAIQHWLFLLTGPEILSGSTRLKAGTVTKMVLNMISTISMIQLGKVYDHYMIDLQITNAKLQQRARRIIHELTGLSAGAIDDLLQAAQGEVKTALLMHFQQLDYAAARQQLDAVAGHLHQALQVSGD
ncbi:MAG: N-acetylmuramic acid 6-phosphate etherase [Candidatus Sericytochromatia bacterium]|nr:N-acetylmuramic acid 6-phosphate etherase [Candidatus Sericytochromatia bacterium]